MDLSTNKGVNKMSDLPKEFVTTQLAISGYMAVHVWTNCEDIEGECFLEPFNTGFGRYENKEHAIKEAKQIAEDLNLPYIKMNT